MPVLEAVHPSQLVPESFTSAGFHVVSGPRTLVRTLMDEMITLLSNENRVSGQGPETGRLMWIDSGNTFDAYYMASKSRQCGLDPRRALRAIQLARPFTAFQLQQMLDKVPKPVFVNGRKVLPLVVISDLMGLFYDEEISASDVRRAFQEFCWRMSYLKKRATVLALSIDQEIPMERRHFLSHVMSLADLPRYPKVGYGAYASNAN